ncbi:dihydrofolate reductase [Sphingorhabdus arenilitoris]|uniref:Dihydrofolate reductase n=1 Tax=Sphingorhabdus arenilitoris TaxID=1490041 RepID=A0ABV8RD62_9SPHN
MNHPEIILVVARADNGVIGKDGDMPWHIPADLRHFKQITKGRPMIMGRKTFESLPGILEGRRHIILTRDTEWEVDEDSEDDDVEIAYSPEEALKKARSGHVCIIGGAEIYALFLDRADRVELTEIHSAPDGDTVIPPFDPEIWTETGRTDHPATDKIPAYSFVTLKRTAAV